MAFFSPSLRVGHLEGMAGFRGGGHWTSRTARARSTRYRKQIEISHGIDELRDTLKAMRPSGGVITERYAVV